MQARELAVHEITQVSGGLTENECIGMLTLGGAGLGAVMGGVGGAGLGGLLGNAAGQMLCNSLINPSSGSPRGGK